MFLTFDYKLSNYRLQIDKLEITQNLLILKSANLQSFNLKLNYPLYGVYSGGDHLFPFRTEKLSPPAQMVLGLKPGRVCRCQFFNKTPSVQTLGVFCFIHNFTVCSYIELKNSKAFLNFEILLMKKLSFYLFW